MRIKVEKSAVQLFALAPKGSPRHEFFCCPAMESLLTTAGMLGEVGSNLPLKKSSNGLMIKFGRSAVSPIWGRVNYCPFCGETIRYEKEN